MEEGRREAGGEETGGEWDVAPAAHAVEDAAMEIDDQMQDEVLESATVVPAQSGTVTQENDPSGGNTTAYAMLPPPNSIPLDSILANTRVAPYIQAVRERLQDADVISKCEFLGSDSDPLFHTLEQDAEDWESYQEKLKQGLIENEPPPVAPTPQPPEGSVSPTPVEPPTPAMNGPTTTELQQNLKSALSEVLRGLKNFKEHSFPFLTRVKKSEAANYYDIIKHPMHLALMEKKLPDYTSKAEFQVDLDLIYSNCRTFNTSPESREYLVHCDELEKKANELMMSVPDIDLSEKKVKVEGKGTRPEEEGRRGPGRPRKIVKPGLPAVDNPYGSMPLFDLQAAAQRPNITWEELTQPYRLAHMKYRESQRHLPISDRDALVRTSDNMAAYLANTQSQAPFFFPEISHYLDTVPEIHPEFPVPEPEHETEDHPATQPIPSSIVSTNIETLQRINLLRYRVLSRKKQVDPPIKLQQTAPVTIQEGTTMDDGVARAILQKSITLMLAHTNYEGATQSAMEVLTDVTCAYFRKLGKLLNIVHSTNEDPKKTLKKTLKHMGIPRVADLKSYVDHDLRRFGHKLRRIEDNYHRRYDAILEKQPSPEQGAEQPSDQPEGTVQDLQDQGTQQQLKEEGAGGEGNAAATVGGERSFLSGNFGDVQIDILGLGELGIGQVPMSLLTGEKEADRTNGAEAPKLLEENSTVGFEDDEEEGDSPADEVEESMEGLKRKHGRTTAAVKNKKIKVEEEDIPTESS